MLLHEISVGSVLVWALAGTEMTPAEGTHGARVGGGADDTGVAARGEMGTGTGRRRSGRVRVAPVRLEDSYETEERDKRKAGPESIMVRIWSPSRGCMRRTQYPIGLLSKHIREAKARLVMYLGQDLLGFPDFLGTVMEPGQLKLWQEEWDTRPWQRQKVMIWDSVKDVVYPHIDSPRMPDIAAFLNAREADGLHLFTEERARALAAVYGQDNRDEASLDSGQTSKVRSPSVPRESIDNAIARANTVRVWDRKTRSIRTITIDAAEADTFFERKANCYLEVYAEQDRVPIWSSSNGGARLNDSPTLSELVPFLSRNRRRRHEDTEVYIGQDLEGYPSNWHALLTTDGDAMRWAGNAALPPKRRKAMIWDTVGEKIMMYHSSPLLGDLVSFLCRPHCWRRDLFTGQTLSNSHNKQMDDLFKAVEADLDSAKIDDHDREPEELAVCMQDKHGLTTEVQAAIRDVFDEIDDEEIRQATERGAKTEWMYDVLTRPEDAVEKFANNSPPVRHPTSLRHRCRQLIAMDPAFVDVSDAMDVEQAESNEQDVGSHCSRDSDRSGVHHSSLVLPQTEAGIVNKNAFEVEAERGVVDQRKESSNASSDNNQEALERMAQVSAMDLPRGARNTDHASVPGKGSEREQRANLDGMEISDCVGNEVARQQAVQASSKIPSAKRTTFEEVTLDGGSAPIYDTTVRLRIRSPARERASLEREQDPGIERQEHAMGTRITRSRTKRQLYSEANATSISSEDSDDDDDDSEEDVLAEELHKGESSDDGFIAHDEYDDGDDVDSGKDARRSAVADVQRGAPDPACLNVERTFSRNMPVRIWNAIKSEVWTDTVPLSEACDLCMKNPNLSIYDGQDFDFERGLYCEYVRCPPSEAKQWQIRRFSKDPANRKVRIWCLRRHKMYGFSSCPTVGELVDWLAQHRVAQGSKFILRVGIFGPQLLARAHFLRMNPGSTSSRITSGRQHRTPPKRQLQAEERDGGTETRPAKRVRGPKSVLNSNHTQSTPTASATLQWAEKSGLQISEQCAQEMMAMGPDERIALIDPASGVIIRRGNAPKLKNVQKYLRHHPTFEIYDRFVRNDQSAAAGLSISDDDGTESGLLDVDDREPCALARATAHQEAIRMRVLAKKILNTSLAGDPNQTFRQEMERLGATNDIVDTLVKRMQSPEYVFAAETLLRKLENLDVYGCFTYEDGSIYAPPSLMSIRSKFESGSIFSVGAVAVEFRFVCASLMHFNVPGSMHYSEAEILFLTGEQTMFAYKEDNPALFDEDEMLTGIFDICARALEHLEKIGRDPFQETFTPNSPRKPAIRVRCGGQERIKNGKQMSYLNYRDEKGHSHMGKRQSARVFGLAIDGSAFRYAALPTSATDESPAVPSHSDTCHTCSQKVVDSPSNALLCMNQMFGLCDRVVCRECLVTVYEMEPSEFVRLRQAADWCCVHCRNACPRSLECTTADPVDCEGVQTREICFSWYVCEEERQQLPSVWTVSFARRTLDGEYEPFEARYQPLEMRLDHNTECFKCKTTLHVGAYRCKISVDDKWIASTTIQIYPLPRKQGDPKLTANRPPSQGLYDTGTELTPTRATVQAVGHALGERRIVWSLAGSKGEGCVSSLDKSGRSVIRQCSRTEGYDWKASKRHAIVQWAPMACGKPSGLSVTRGIDHVDRLPSTGATLPSPDGLALCASLQIASDYLSKRPMPKLAPGQSYKSYIEAWDTAKFDEMKSSTLWGIVTGKSNIHGIGLFTLTGYKKGDFVIEYAGDLIRTPLADLREARYDAAGLGTYLFKINDREIVDATVNSNRARFTNHSCDPNMAAEIVTVRGRDLVVLRATRFIPVMSELTFNYQFPLEEKKLTCFCNAWNCEGVMN